MSEKEFLGASHQGVSQMATSLLLLGALERSKYIFPTHTCYKKLMVGAIDVTMAFVALANVGLPDNYNYVWLGQDESGSLLLLS